MKGEPDVCGQWRRRAAPRRDVHDRCCRSRGVESGVDSGWIEGGYVGIPRRIPAQCHFYRHKILKPPILRSNRIRALQLQIAFTSPLSLQVFRQCDIATPTCFETERRTSEEHENAGLPIHLFFFGQRGTATGRTRAFGWFARTAIPREAKAYIQAEP